MVPSFDTLDTNAFKAFWLAAETLSFTQAAKLGNLTQSGVSQHVRRLEEQLGVALFERVQRKVVLTEAGARLRDYVERFFNEQAELKQSLTETFTEVHGPVRYAMPESCLLSPHFALLLKEHQRAFPKVELSVTVCPSRQVVQELVDGNLDFGFVTTQERQASVDYQPFCFEEYVLACKPPLPQGLDAKALGELPVISYPGAEVIFSIWSRRVFARKRDVAWRNLHLVGHMSSLRGAIMMVEAGLGVSVLPLHCVAPQARKKSLAVYRSKDRPVHNQIHLVSLPAAHRPQRVRVVIDAFMAMVA